MESSGYRVIKDSLRQLYLDDPRPWLVGYSGGKDSTMVASLVFDAVLSVPPDQRKKEIAILCTDTRVEIPAIGMKRQKVNRGWTRMSANAGSLECHSELVEESLARAT